MISEQKLEFAVWSTMLWKQLSWLDGVGMLAQIFLACVGLAVASVVACLMSSNVVMLAGCSVQSCVQLSAVSPLSISQRLLPQQGVLSRYLHWLFSMYASVHAYIFGHCDASPVFVVFVC